MENKRIIQALENLKILEKNCTDSKKGFKPNVVVCMYLIECILEVVDIYPVKVLRQLPIETSFENRELLLEFLDDTIGRMKRVEHYAFSKSEILDNEETTVISVFDLIIDKEFEARGQLEKFLVDLLNRLNMVHELTTDPRRSQAKISYHERMFNAPLTQIASLLEALSIGIANV